MIATDVPTRRPLIGAIAGLLFVSACGTAAESTPTQPTPTQSTPIIEVVVDRTAETTPAAPADRPLTTTPPTPSTTPTTTDPPATTPPPTTPPTTADTLTTSPPTTTPPPTTPPGTEPPADPAPIDVVDVSGRTVFGIGVFDAVDVDVVARDVSARLGSPTTDSGWQSMEGRVNCAGSTDSRVLWWGDFRMTFERYRGGDVVRDELSAWTVGDPTVVELAPIGDVPAASPSNIVTLGGIGLGSTLADVEAVWANINQAGDGRLVVVDRGGLVTIGLDDADQVIGLGNGPFDCPVDEMR